MEATANVSQADQAEFLRRTIWEFVEFTQQRSDVDPNRRRRQRYRHQRSWPLAVLESNHASAAEMTAALHNASDQGIAFLSRRAFDRGSVLLIRLFWHDEQSPRIPAVVRHTTPTADGYLVGCEFDVYWRQPPLGEPQRLVMSGD